MCHFENCGPFNMVLKLELRFRPHVLISGMGQIRAGSIGGAAFLEAAQRVLAKDQAARRVLDQWQGPGVWWEHGKIWTYTKYEHTIDNFYKICFSYGKNDMLWLFLSWYTIVEPSWPTIDSKILLKVATKSKRTFFLLFSGPDLTHILWYQSMAVSAPPRCTGNSGSKGSFTDWCGCKCI